MAFPLHFLICTERSGSNLVTRMLDSHPEVCGPPPAHLVRTLAGNLLRYGDLARDAGWDALLEDAAALLENQLGRWHTRFTAEGLRSEVSERSLAALVRQVYAREARAHRKRVAFVKENRTQRLLPYLLLAFPEARFVYLVRDPRDVALSWKLSANHPGGVARAADVWCEDQEESLRCAGYLAPERRLHLLRYEDLIGEPERELRELCGFLGLDWSAAMLDFHQAPSTLENSARIRDWENLGRPLLAENKRKYGALALPEVRYVETRCRETMTALGYPPEHPAGDEAELAEEVAGLASGAPEAAPPLPPEEEAIRERRLAVIRRIRQRPLDLASLAGGSSARSQ